MTTLEKVEIEKKLGEENTPENSQRVWYRVTAVMRHGNKIIEREVPHVVTYIPGRGNRIIWTLPDSLSPHPSERVIRVLELFQFLLPPRVKREVFEPAFNDLLEDFLITARSYNSKWERRCLNFCFAVRIGWMVIESLWAMCGSLILLALPEKLRKYLGK